MYLRNSVSGCKVYQQSILDPLYLVFPNLTKAVHGRLNLRTVAHSVTVHTFYASQDDVFLPLAYDAVKPRGSGVENAYKGSFARFMTMRQ